MGTVSKEIADEVIAGKYPEDECIEITEYDNAFGGVSYGLTYKGHSNVYTPSEYVRNPRCYWRLTK